MTFKKITKISPVELNKGEYCAIVLAGVMQSNGGWADERR